MTAAGGASGPAGRITTYAHDGLTFDVIDEGPIDGDVVVLLHGFPERASSWRLVAPLLHAQGYRTLAPDQRGYSPGARPPRRRDYRFDLLVDDVAALVDTVGGPVHVVGHDWGANVAWGVAMWHPAKVRSLTAFSVPHPAAYASALKGPQALRSWYIAMFNLPRVVETLAARPGGFFDKSLRRGGMTEADVARFHEEIVDHGALPGGLGWYRALPFMRSVPHDQGAHVTVPTTMVWSDGDGFISRVGVERAGRYVDAPYELVVLEGVTHWIPEQAPEAAAEAILERLVTTP